jgi:hypothetical protein
MDELGLDTIMTLLPVEAQEALLSKLKVSKETTASPAGDILMVVYILEYMGFPKYVDEIFGERHLAIEQLKEHWHNRAESVKPLVPSTGVILSLMVADMIACPRNITPTYKFEKIAQEWRTGPLLGIEPSLLNVVCV